MPGIAWVAISCLVTLACALFVSYGVYGFMPNTPLTSTIPYWILSGPFLGWESSSAAATADMLIGGACTLVSIASVLMMGYAGFTLGATWARQHKVVCGIALFLGIWLAVSMVSTVVFAVAGAIMAAGPSWSGFGALMQVLGFLRDAAVCAICFAVCYVCLKGHVNLS